MRLRLARALPRVMARGNSAVGASYSILDQGKDSSLATAYFVEDLDVFGRVTLHGPIMVERVAPTRADGDPRVVPTR